MNIALLFDAYFPPYNKGNYYWATRRLVFKTGIIQAADRHMKMSVGDVILDFDGTREQRIAVREAVYFEHAWGLIHEDRLRDTFGRAEVFAMVFENMPQAVAEKLHKRLSRSKGYLGLKAVEFGFGAHLVVFRNRISAKYRLKGLTARAFYSMGEEDGKDEYDLAEMRKLGFSDVAWEDQGARKTIFDDFDTIEHFRQVTRFREAVTPFLTDGMDDAYQLVMELEDLNPQLFNALGAAVDAITNAQHEEHIAQAALSGRRYMEKLADTLFPARSKPHNGRNVGADKYKNRLWAFVTDNLDSGDTRAETLGKEIDRLVEELNGGLHGDRPKERILKALADAAKLTSSLLILNPTAARQPYAPFMDGLRRFFKEIEQDRGKRRRATLPRGD